MLSNKIHKNELMALYGLKDKISPLGDGLINQTYFASTQTGSQIVLQRINTEIFLTPHHITENILVISKELSNSSIYDLDILTPVQNLKGEDSCFTKDGSYWRATKYSSDLKSVNLIENSMQAYEGGFAFGIYSAALIHIDPRSIHETIPNFHDLISRFEKFKIAITQDTVSRVAKCSDEINYILNQRHVCEIWTSYKKKLPLRITHNDTKINNLLFCDNDKARMVIDLDTTMPGLLMHDFGDMVRTMTPTVDENSTNLDQLSIREDIFSSMTKGYLEALNPIITELEISSLLFGAQAITLIMSLRFLTDYLQGDHYFKTTSENHNLERSRNQIRLNKEIVKNYEKLEKIIKSHVSA
jgi:hypothetical protein